MLALLPTPRPRPLAPRMGLWVPSSHELDGLRRRVLRFGHVVPARAGTPREARRLLGPVGFRAPAEAPPEPAWEGGLKRDVAALKTHLDLLNESGRAAGEPGGAFWYDAPEALTRLGYRRQGHGAFNSDTLARHVERVRALCEGEAAPWRLTGEASFTASGTPRRLRVAPGPELGRWLAKLPPDDARGITDALLALPTHGQGNAQHRLAVSLAATLAGWARAGARRGAGRVVRPLGRLLEEAGVATLTELQDAQLRSPNAAKRLRANLAGEGFDDEGAFALLRRLGGYALDVVDEGAFWASGPGWLQRFWEAPVALTLGS